MGREKGDYSNVDRRLPFERVARSGREDARCNTASYTPLLRNNCCVCTAMAYTRLFNWATVVQSADVPREHSCSLFRGGTRRDLNRDLIREDTFARGRKTSVTEAGLNLLERLAAEKRSGGGASGSKCFGVEPSVPLFLYKLRAKYPYVRIRGG